MITKEAAKKIIVSVMAAIAVYSFISLYWPEAAWFWTAFMTVGLLLLLIFSPQHRVIKGIRSIPLIYWPFLMVVPVFFIIVLARYKINIEARIVMGLCFLMFEFGMEVFWKRVFSKKEGDKSQGEKGVTH